MQLMTDIQGEGTPLVCLHGHPGSRQSMRVFTDHLSQRCRTFTPDLRGYGSSQTLRPFAMAQHLDDLTELLDRYNLNPCWVLGWSLGGILAMELALKHPDRIQGLILVATAARPFGDHPPITWQDNVNTGIASILNRIRPGHPWVINHWGRKSLYRYLVQRHTPEVYRHLADEALPAFLKTSPQAQRALAQALKRRYNRLADLRHLELPALVLAGRADRHINAAASEETARHLPCSQYRCYEDVAHLFPWEIPHQVLADIDLWLDAQGVGLQA